VSRGRGQILEIHQNKATTHLESIQQQALEGDLVRVGICAFSIRVVLNKLIRERENVEDSCHTSMHILHKVMKVDTPLSFMW
jgi:hypothetical protein